MAEIKQEWIEALAAKLGDGDRSATHCIDCNTAFAEALQAVAPLIRADALREAADICRDVSFLPGKTLEQTDQIHEIGDRIRALIDAPKGDAE